MLKRQLTLPAKDDELLELLPLELLLNETILSLLLEETSAEGSSGMSSELVQLAKRTATTSIATIFTPFFSNIFRLLAMKCRKMTNLPNAKNCQNHCRGAIYRARTRCPNITFKHRGKNGFLHP
jgi:hypothetical protein